MLILLQITTEGGTEAFSYKTEKYKQVMVDTQLLSGFMEALQLLSETIGSPLQQIQLANLMLYVSTYGNFSLR